MIHPYILNVHDIFIYLFIYLFSIQPVSAKDILCGVKFRPVGDI